jgi:hypothetical protein
MTDQNKIIFKNSRMFIVILNVRLNDIILTFKKSFFKEKNVKFWKKKLTFHYLLLKTNFFDN